jgi:hypothetical protein
MIAVISRIEVSLEPDVHQVGDVGDNSRVNRSHGRKKGETVDPTNEPAIARSNVVFAVLIERARQWVLTGQLPKDECHQSHERDDDRNRPDVAWPTRAGPDHEDGVDTHDRTQVSERHREVVKEREHPGELLAIPQRAQALVISRGLFFY